MLPFCLAVVGTFVASYQGWRDSRDPWEKPTKRRMSRRRWLILATTIFTIAILSINSFPQLQTLLRPQNDVVTYLKIGRVSPQCTIASLVVYPTGPTKSLQMTLQFDQPIRDHVLQTGFINDSNMGIKGAVSTDKDACKISTPPSERNDSLTFQVTSDRYAVLINGRNFNKYDGQTVVLTLFSYGGTLAKAKANGMATYEAAGHDVPAKVILIRGPNDTETLQP
jgi:heme/copper-type cytochrome/quinol oxidase subunit 2